MGDDDDRKNEESDNDGKCDWETPPHTKQQHNSAIPSSFSQNPNQQMSHSERCVYIPPCEICALPLAPQHDEPLLPLSPPVLIVRIEVAGILRVWEAATRLCHQLFGLLVDHSRGWNVPYCLWVGGNRGVKKEGVIS